MKAAIACVVGAVLGICVWELVVHRGDDDPGPRVVPDEGARGKGVVQSPSTAGESSIASRELVEEAGLAGAADDPLAEIGIAEPWAGLEDHVRERPRWSDDDSAFEDKYREFSPSELQEAVDVLGGVIREESQPWIDSRLATGDYERERFAEDGAPRGFAELDHDYSKGPLFCRVMTGSEHGERGSIRFYFPPDEYPDLQLRLREQDWVLQELRRIGHTASN